MSKAELLALALDEIGAAYSLVRGAARKRLNTAIKHLKQLEKQLKEKQDD